MTPRPAPRERRELILALFARLDECGVRYAVLHSYEELPDDLPSDLDLAVHPADARHLPRVLRALAEGGFAPAQCIPYAAGGWYFVFLWPAGGGIDSLAVDFTFQHREGGLILLPGEQLVAGRVRRGQFWIPRPEIEFAYLLAKKTLKGNLPARQADRLRGLAIELGTPAAEDVAAHWYGQRWKSAVVAACVAGGLSERMGEMKRRFWRATLRRDPLNPVRRLASELPRLLRRVLHPTGLSFAVLGPDGAGKSTLLSGLLPQIQPAFRSTRCFHWRPFLVPGKQRVIAASPHRLAADSAARSLVRLAAHVADYHLGNLLRVRPALIRAGLVVFDRYFHDMLADPRRYRYGGPMALARLAARLMPKPDLVLILDAPEAAVHARKQEVPLPEIARQRQAFLQLARAMPRASVLDAGLPAEAVLRQAAEIVVRFMQARLPRQAASFGFPTSGGGDRLDTALQRLQASASGDGPAHSFAMLPSRRHPSLLLPLENRAAARRALDIYSPYQRRARILKSVLAQAIALPACCRPGHRLDLPAGSLSALEALVAETTGEERPAFAISLGRAASMSRLTIQAMRPSGEILGYVKLALTPEAEARVQHEAATLLELRRFSHLRPDLPEVRFAGEWRGRYALVQSPGAGEPGPAAFNGLHTRFLDGLRRASAVTRTGEALVEEAGARWEQTAAALDPSWRALGRDALRAAGAQLRGADIACGVWHGDFAPWNTRVRDGRLFVYDWEAAEWDMPVCWDMFHFDLQVSFLLRRPSGVDLARLDAPAWNGLYLLYLLRSVARCREDDSGAAALEYRRQRLRRLLAGAPRLMKLEAIHAGSR